MSLSRTMGSPLDACVHPCGVGGADGEQPLDDLFFLHLKSEDDDAHESVEPEGEGHEDVRSAHVG